MEDEQMLQHVAIATFATQYTLCGKAGAHTMGQECGCEFGSWPLILILQPRNLALALSCWGCNMQTGVAQYGEARTIRQYICASANASWQ